MMWSRNGSIKAFAWRVALSGLFLFSGACSLRQGMYNQAKYKPLSPSEFFADGRSQRQPVEGTVARGELREDTHFYRGLVNGKPATSIPFPVTKDVLIRGQERFNIYCSVCHGRTGRGDGMVVRRGFKHPPSFHEQRLRQVADGYVFTVITDGFGAMPGYAVQIEPRDRWNIIAYLRALQLSQNASLADVPPSDREKLK